MLPDRVSNPGSLIYGSSSIVSQFADDPTIWSVSFLDFINTSVTLIGNCTDKQDKLSTILI